MNVLVIGGGKVGFYLAKTLIEHGHEPSIIEKNKDVCRIIANDLDIPVVNGDGTLLEILESANVGRAEVVVSVTGQDQDNLVACQLAKKLFHVGRTVARVNNPKNTDIMYKLGVDIPICSTDHLAKLIEREVDTSVIKQIISLDRGTASLSEFVLPDDFVLTGKPLSDIKIPSDAVIVSVVRGEEFMIPRGNTVLMPGDRVMVLAKNEAFHFIKTLFGLTD